MAASAAAALLGAPLMHDFAVISLSDLMTPWEVIEKRLRLAADGDFVITLYNPASYKRRRQVEMAREIIMNYRAASTPVGIVKDAMRQQQVVIITDIEHMLDHGIDMTSVVIIGNASTYINGGHMITPRGYNIEKVR